MHLLYKSYLGFLALGAAFTLLLYGTTPAPADSADPSHAPIPLLVQTIMHPNADQETAGRGTRLIGLNNDGHMVGRYVDPAGMVHGFLLIGDPGEPDSFRDIDFPGATGTEAFAINNQGQIVGVYFDAAGLGHGYVLNGDPADPEAYTPLDVGSPPLNTYVTGINDEGVMVGSFMDAQQGRVRGFRLSGTVLETFDASAEPTDATIVNGINNEGLIYGGYGAFDPILGQPHTCLAFALDPALNPISRFEIEGAPVTVIMGINAGGVMSGFYDLDAEDDTQGTHGFLLIDETPINPIDIGEGQTVIGAINDHGAFVGFYNFAEASVAFQALLNPPRLFLPIIARDAQLTP